MRDPLRQIYDEAEKREADPAGDFRAVQERLEKPASRRPLLLAVSIASALALVVVGLAAVQVTTPPPVISHDAVNIRTSASADQGPDVGTLMGMCSSFSDTDGNTLDWSRAVDACQKVLTVDPINVDARKLKKLSEKELAQRQIYDQARRLLDLGRQQEAMDQYVRIDSDSFYYRMARHDFRAAFAELSKTAKDPERLASRQEYGRFLKETTVVGEATKLRYEAIKKMYPDPELADAVSKYASDPNLGMQAVQRYLGKGGKDEAQAKEAYRHMGQAQSTHQTGYEAMLRFDLKTAATSVRGQLAADAMVMPPTQESDLSKQTRRDISERFAKRGKELFQGGRLLDSFDMCEGGGEFQLGNPSVLECYSDLENKAAAMVDQGCQGASQATKITRKDSPVHKQAEKALKDQGC